MALTTLSPGISLSAGHYNHRVMVVLVVVVVVLVVVLVVVMVVVMVVVVVMVGMVVVCYGVWLLVTALMIIQRY